MNPNSEGAWTNHAMPFFVPTKLCKSVGGISAPSQKDIDPIVVTSGNQFTFSITNSIFK